MYRASLFSLYRKAFLWCFVAFAAFLANGFLFGQAGPAATPEPLATQDTRFSHHGGFHEEPFAVVIATDTPGAVIRYTLDGSEPAWDHGALHESPIRVESTTILRAAAFRQGLAPSNVDTQSYLFLDDILHQPADVAGWPRPVLSIGNGTRRHDYEMDPDIVDAPGGESLLRRAFDSIPSLSLAVDPRDMWDENGEGGFYRGDVEKPASVELIYPGEPDRRSQVRAGVQGHSHDRLKRSLRLKFRSEYGDAKWKTTLLEDAALNGDTAVEEYDRLILRAGNNRSWARSWNPDKTAYTMDQWYRDSQIAMSGIGSRGAFVHLFINGLYWGLYNVVERTDAWFASAHFGGDEEDWFAASHGGDQGGDPSRWNFLINDLANRDMAEDGNYRQLQNHLDLENLCDYILLSWYINVTDWPQNNWWAVMRNNPPGPARFVAWDGEWSFGLGASPGEAWVHPDFRRSQNGGPPVARLWHAARRNPEFLILFADRAFKHLAQDGALTDEKARERWSQLNAFVRDAVVAESARWGDAIDPDRPRTRDADWQNEVGRIHELMKGNADKLIEAMRREQFYPAIDPPELNLEQGRVALGTELRFTGATPDRRIYYTVNGGDPRLPGGAVNRDARLYSASILAERNLLIRARAVENQVWSALREALFVTTPLKLRISEIMYHPSSPTEAERLAGFDDQNDFEFLEIANAGGETIALAGVRLEQGVRFVFNEHSLLPGKAALLAKNREALEFRYGAGLAIAGEYQGSLDNSGERLILLGPLGETLIDFEYSDDWIASTDGDGPSLQLKDLQTQADALNDPSNWTASSRPLGSPGAIGSFKPKIRIAAEIASEGQLRLTLAGTPNTRWDLLSSTDWIQWRIATTLTLNEEGNAWVEHAIDHGNHSEFFIARERRIDSE